MRINSELIQHSNHFINTVGERQLDLRSKKITAIENLGATLDFFENIDLSDNEIKRLGNFSLLNRLKTLNLTNNRVSKLTDISDSLPQIENLCLINNKLSDVNEIIVLRKCKNLKRLILHGNIVTQTPDYRLRVIGAIKHLRVLDFQKISKKSQERELALQKYQQEEQADMQALDELKNGFVQKDQLKQIIQNAKTHEEINKIELLLKQAEEQKSV